MKKIKNKTIKKILKRMIPWIDRNDRIIRLYKKSHKYYLKKRLLIAGYYAYKISNKYGCYISPKAVIGDNIKMPHPIGIVIGDGVEIGNNCVIYQNVTIGRKNRDVEQYPKIGNETIIYSNAVVIGNIQIGNNVTIGCNALIMGNVEDNSKVVGIVK